MKKTYSKILSCLFTLMYCNVSYAQNTIKYTFDDTKTEWEAIKGSAETIQTGAYKGKALKIHPNSTIKLDVDLQPSSTYRLTAWMRTESGADAVTIMTDKLGKNNISGSTALASWTKIEKDINVSANQHEAEIKIVFENTQGSTNAWVDEIELVRTGTFKEKIYAGIPPEIKRESKEHLGIKTQPDSVIKWMLDDKIGMFIHWGLYAGPAKGEWYMENKGIRPEEYRKLAYKESGDEYFTAKDFNADKWAELAKNIGAKYMCMTTQHHDGYALFESKYMNVFTSKQTHNRDFVKEYTDACRKAGLKVGLYKTLINWRFPGYYDIYGTNCLRNKFGYTTDASHKENARLMKEELYCQTKELMTKYGKIDHIFWDGGWIGQQGSDADGAPFWESGKYMDPNNEWPINEYFQDIDSVTGKPLGLMGIVRKYQPNVVVNSRCGWIGDFGNEEGGGEVKGEIRSGVVEKCFTIAPGWGYTTAMEDPTKIMPITRIKRIFADCMVRNMCFLINVGPDRHGNVPKPVEDRLLEFGNWIKKIRDAVYSTRGGPWQPVDGQYGFTYKDNKIYLYLLGEYADEDFLMPQMDKGMKIKKAYNLYTGEKIKVSRKSGNTYLKNINAKKDDITVIAIELNRNVRNDKREAEENSDRFLNQIYIESCIACNAMRLSMFLNLPIQDIPTVPTNIFTLC